MTDLSKFFAVDPDAEAVLELIDPRTKEKAIGDDGKPITIRLLGFDADRVVEHTTQVSNRRLEAARRGKRNQTAEEIDADTVDLLTVCTVGWSFDTLAGEPFPYSADNARRLYQDRRFRSIREQVDTFITDRRNFMRG